jgi:hypothetical protein
MSNPPQRSQKPKSAAQRASEKNNAQQTAVNAKTSRPSDRRNVQPGEISDAGLLNDNRPAGLARR